MNNQAVITQVEEHVKNQLTHEKAAHDWLHINRVRNMALRIAQSEPDTDLFIVELMALLHEAADRKVVGSENTKEALVKLRTFLESLGINDEEVEEILYVIDNQSFSKSGITGEKLQSKNGQCLQDADRLEAIGAIGIARCFAYNGKQGNPIHDPTIARPSIANTKEYEVKSGSTTINHFYEKLLKIKDLMNTKTGKKLATHRHQFMESFLEEFFAEWEGKR